MPLVPARDVMDLATVAGYGVALVAPDSTDMAQLVLDAAVAEEAPVVLAVAADADEAFVAALRPLADAVKVPAYLHALAGNGRDAQALAALGVAAMAVDFTALDPDQNLAATTKAVRQAQDAGLWAVAALGWVSMNLDPERGASFARECGCNALDVDTSTGTLAIPTLLSLANRLITFPLAVSNPGVAASTHESGLENWLTRAAHMGLCQVNFTDQMRQAFQDGGGKAATERLRELMRAIGSTGRW